MYAGALSAVFCGVRSVGRGLVWGVCDGDGECPSEGLWVVGVTSSGWPFVLAVPGLMTHLVASLTLDSVRSYAMQGTSFTQGKVSSIPIVFSWSGNISLNGFLPSILLLVMIIVAVVLVVLLVKASSIPIGWANEFHQDKASSVRVPVENFTLQSSVQLLQRNTDLVCLNQRIRPTAPSVPLKLKVFSMLAACASKAAATLSATSFLMAARVMASAADVDVLLGAILLTFTRENKNPYNDIVISQVIVKIFIHSGFSRIGSLSSGRGMIHNELSNSAKIDSSKGESGGGVVDLTGDEDPTDEDGDNGMDHPT
ncbi:hypothetical protein Tco_0507599 [Tanacetum coccineum]